MRISAPPRVTEAIGTEGGRRRGKSRGRRQADRIDVARREQELKVEVPRPGQDRPELGRVGIIAAVGFAIGVVWPWLAGVRLVPSPPVDESPEPAVAASVAPGAPSAGVSQAADVAKAEPGVTTETTVKVGEAQVTGCRNGKKKVKECDSIAFDAVAKGRLSALLACEAARGARETLSIGFELDFEKGTVTDVFAGKSTTFSKEKAKTLVECTKKEFDGVRLDGIEHEHERYTVFYFVEFVPPGTPVAAAPGAAPADEETTEASGLATVSWDVAVVRDQPDGGSIVTRLRYGTRVVVVARRGSWYEVKYDAKGRRGWVHKNALGL